MNTQVLVDGDTRLVSSKRKTQVLIDGDPIVYRIGYANQQRRLHCVIEWPDDTVKQEHFASKTERNEFIRGHSGAEIADEEDEIIPEPVHHAYAGVKRLLGEIADEAGSDDLHIILSESFGKGNFRQAIAKQKPYKGNRKQPRPAHYQAIRDYMEEQWGALVVETREADDELSIRARDYREKGIPYVVASIDKDLDQIPGRHYDYARKVSYDISEVDARRAFWIQALAGDPTDNIPGCWKVGDGKASVMVDSWIADGYDDKRIFEAILAEYKKSQQRQDCPYKGQDPLHVAIETAQLIYMQQKPGELWAPPGVPFGRIGSEIDD